MNSPHRKVSYEPIIPANYITIKELAELCEKTKPTIAAKLRDAGLEPTLIKRVNDQGQGLGGRPLFIYPRNEAIYIVLAD